MSNSFRFSRTTALFGRDFLYHFWEGIVLLHKAESSTITARLADILASVESPVPVTVRSLSEAIAAYIVDLARRNASMRTMYCAFNDLDRFDEDLSLYEPDRHSPVVAKLTRQVVEAHIARFASGREVRCSHAPSPHTVERRRRILKTFLRWLHSEEYIESDITRKLSPIPLRERIPSVWSLHDVERFINTFHAQDLSDHRDYMIALVALSSGLRAGELAFLKVGDVDARNCTLAVSVRGKTGARVAVMAFDTAKQLDKWIRRLEREQAGHKSTPLFPSLSGRCKGDHLRPSSISHMIAKHAKKAGITGVKLGAHALRHTSATHLALQGASAFEIQQFLGHCSIEMSQRYVAMSTAAVQRRVETHGIMAQITQSAQATDEREAIIKRLRSGR